jgi:Tetratricopeptide repeat
VRKVGPGQRPATLSEGPWTRGLVGAREQGHSAPGRERRGAPPRRFRAAEGREARRRGSRPREALAIGRTVFGPVHPGLAGQVNNWPWRSATRAALRKRRASPAKWWRSRASSRAGASRDRAATQQPRIDPPGRGEPDAAIAPAREGLEMRRRLSGPDPERVAMSLGKLGDLMEQEGDLAESRAL